MKMDGRQRGWAASGCQDAVVSGDPSKAGPFVIRAKFPANYAVRRTAIRADEVVAGLVRCTLTYGMGDKVNPGNSDR